MRILLPFVPDVRMTAIRPHRSELRGCSYAVPVPAALALLAAMALVATLALLAALAMLAAPAAAQTPYHRMSSPLLTPWTGSVSSTDPLPDYPRPELQRTRWMSLNGPWQYESGASAPPFGQQLGETILVPFPVQSPLSGIERDDRSGWYRREFTVPAGWHGDRVLLNFGAVTWAATVYVNGRRVGSHTGSYTSFSFDITAAVHRQGPNELVVGYLNPMGGADEPVGKQNANGSYGVHHTASSGIWQTVWLEPVAASHITGLTVVPDLRRHRVRIRVAARTAGPVRVLAEALDGGHLVATARGGAGRTLTLSLPHPHLWSPADPFLYRLRLMLVAGRRTVDRVQSYFGMRSISLGYVAGHVRVLLNGHFVFQSGVLDQGLWPDGLYAAPTDAALRFDLLAAKRLGYNMIRAHEKVETDRWYYWADRIGLLVWQDMPSPPVVGLPRPTAAGRADFLRELADAVTERQMHPSIVTWVPFNEGWGQFDEAGITRTIRRLDPAALVDTDGGSANCCAAIESANSDLRDTHGYFGPFAVPSDYRATAIGEYGGMFPFPPANHRWPGPPLSIGSPAVGQSPLIVAGMLGVQFGDLAQEMRLVGLSAAVYTELSAYEQEEGILTYDRRVYTLDPNAIRADNDALIGASQQPSELHSPRAAVPVGASGIWTFDAGRGTVAADGSPVRHPLTLAGGAGWTTGVEGGHALSLPTAAAGATAGTMVVDTEHSFTVSAWLKASRPHETAPAITELGSDGPSFSLGILTEPRSNQVLPGEIASGRLAPALRTWWTFAVPTFPTCSLLTCAVLADTRYGDGRASPRAGVWYAVTGVYDARTLTTSIYVDGVPEDVDHPAHVPPSRGPLAVGGFIGAVDELRTYARALTPGEVWALYAAERAGAR